MDGGKIGESVATAPSTQIGSSSSSPSSLMDPDAQQTQAHLDTLDEPIVDTILRDLRLVGVKLKHVLVPRGDTTDKDLRNWDLWGPLLLCLTLAISLSYSTNSEQTALKFGVVFVIVWCGAGVVTVNAALLGGKISFLQSVCVLGYCLAPLALASIILRVMSFVWANHIVEAIIVFIAFGWATRASVGFMGQLLPEDKRLLGVYPVLLFYLFIGWMILVQDS